MPSRLWTEEAECWGPALPCPRSFGSERRHGVLVVCAERDCRGPGCVCVCPLRTMAVWLGRAAVPRDRSALLGESLRPLQGHHKRRRDVRQDGPALLPEFHRERPRRLPGLRGAVSGSVSDRPRATL